MLEAHGARSVVTDQAKDLRRCHGGGFAEGITHGGRAPKQETGTPWRLFGPVELGADINAN